MPRRLIAATVVAAFVAGFAWTPIASSAPRRLPRIRFVAAPGSSIQVFGRYPKADSPCKRPVEPVLRARYPGTIEIGKDPEGRLFVIGVLPFERYLEGLAEVPRQWPMEALKAQVVAARSYAAVQIGRATDEGAAFGYDLCATPACQVYAGMAVSHGPYGGRWRAAVRATSHQVLLFRDKPAETLYFSTSNGHTYGNDEVFGSDPLPYLRPVPEHDDGASPLSHWEADISFRDLGRFLRAGGHWGKRRIDAVRQAGSTVRVRGGQTVKKIGVDDFRSTLNNWAHCLEPDRYPSFNADGRLPQTVPSHWLRLRTSGRTLMIRGRGWGHGIGMVQWGAYGKAKRGLSYRQILQAYYGGLSPHRYAEPDTIRIGIATGLKAVRLEAAGPVRVENRTAVPGPWLVTGGKHIHLEHSRGPLRRLPAARLVRAPRRVRAGKTFAVRVSVPQLSVLSVALEGEGTFVRLGSGSTHQPGPARLTALVPLSTVSGVYSLRAIATDGVDIVPSNPRRIRIVGGASPSPTPSPAAPSSRSPGPPAPAPSSNRSVAGFLIIGALAVVAAAALVFAALRSRPNRP